jgi:hypothetical protein
MIKTKVQKNPNKWEKHMAPWFEEQCKGTRLKYR